ncbi:hypothetical protein, partial [Streptomyces sp. YS-3]|uniref:hypothetical protein n=1 Tax=Streptomyces sp. YS-3 TaxID=3381352 RepID=UPI0038625767
FLTAACSAREHAVRLKRLWAPLGRQSVSPGRASCTGHRCFAHSRHEEFTVMYEANVRLVDLLGKAPGSYELRVIPLVSATVTCIVSGAGYTVVPLDRGDCVGEEDVQIVVRSRTRPASVVGRGILRLRWSGGRRLVHVCTSDDFPPNLDVAADGRGLVTVRVRSER